MMNLQKLLKIEEDLLLDAIYKRYGYDFRNYVRTSLSRRLQDEAERQKVDCLSELIPKMLHDEEYFCQFLMDVPVDVTEMFRDPEYYLAFKKNVLPSLNTYPFVKIWHAGCSTGEEVYSTAITLQESGMLDRANIYATDINPRSLAKAKEGIYPIELLRKYEDNYQRAEGGLSLSNYYLSKYNFGKMKDELTKHTLFTEHNLSCDAVFGEMNVVVCRNVLIYFNRELQQRAVKLFHDSLCHGGYLCLGDKESLDFIDARKYFDVVDAKAKIFQKRAIPYE